MSLLIKNAKIIIPGSRFNGKRMDIWIEKGKFKQIQKNITAKTKHTIKSKNVCVSLGWMDIGAHTGEPGYEHRETLETFENAALAGGYTGVAIMPNSHPIVDTKSSLQYFKNNKVSKAMDFYPMAAASSKCKGEELTEYIDMARVGAVAFTDGSESIEDGGFMMRALQYSNAVAGPILNTPLSCSMNKDTHMHEGVVSTMLGLKGSPAIAEKITLQRDIELLDYTDSSLISHKISTSDSCKLIKEAKKRTLDITATISYNNLIFVDEDLRSFDSNLKLYPPLRTKRDRLALIRAIKDDTIDAIVSDHDPREQEAKKLEFPYANTGAIGLQTCFAAMWKRLNKRISLVKLIEKLSIGPRKVLNIDLPNFDIGEKANITVFDPNIEWEFKTEDIKSVSKNSPLIDEALQGKVLGVFNNGVFVELNM